MRSISCDVCKKEIPDSYHLLQVAYKVTTLRSEDGQPLSDGLNGNELRFDLCRECIDDAYSRAFDLVENLIPNAQHPER